MNRILYIFNSKRRVYLIRVIRIALLLLIIMGLCLRYNRISRTDVGSFYYDYTYHVEPNTIDVLAIGSSHIYCGLNPVQMYNDYGISAYNLAAGSQAIWNTYYYLEDALKTQTPKVVILDTYTLRYEDEHFDSSIQMNLMGMSISRTKYHALRISGAENWFQMLLRFPITHGRYNKIKRENITQEDGCLLGYQFNLGSEKYEDIVDVSHIEELEPITEKSELYLRKAIELCQSRGIEVVLINVPWPLITEDIQKKYNYVETIASEYQIPYLNLCKNMDEIGIDWKYDSYGDGGHMNYFGVTKTTCYVENYLKKNYMLEDHRDERGFEHWKEACRRLIDKGIQQEALEYGYSRRDSECSACLEFVNEEKISEDTRVEIQLLQQNYISGWIQLDQLDNESIYLKMGSFYFKLVWTDRQDINDQEGKENYHGFEGILLPTNIPLGNYPMSLVVFDKENNEYMEFDLGIVTLKNP